MAGGYLFVPTSVKRSTPGDVLGLTAVDNYAVPPANAWGESRRHDFKFINPGRFPIAIGLPGSNQVNGCKPY